MAGMFENKKAEEEIGGGKEEGTPEAHLRDGGGEEEEREAPKALPALVDVGWDGQVVREVVQPLTVEDGIIPEAVTLRPGKAEWVIHHTLQGLPGYGYCPKQ